MEETMDEENGEVNLLNIDFQHPKSAFKRYSGIQSPRNGRWLSPTREEQMRAGPPQKQRRHPPPLPTLTFMLSVGLLETYRRVNPSFVYVGAIQNPRRVLTKDARPCGNGGMDNKSSDLILTVGDLLCGSQGGHKFRVLDMLGQGTFGQVVKCKAEWSTESEDSSDFESDSDSEFKRYKSPLATPSSPMVAVKIVKNKPAYFNQAKVEIKVLKKISEELGPGINPEEPGSSLIRLLYDFEYHHHLCMVFELMSVNLYELIKHQEFRGLPFAKVRICCTQLLDALKCLCDLAVIHCDLKPENILLENFGDPTNPRIKLIDLGSACYRDHVAFTYIQSRFYRAPEVLLGLPYSSPIDLWSLGCVAIELFMGLPVFPGVSGHNQLVRIIEMLGMPPNWMLKDGKKTETFFVRKSENDGAIREEDEDQMLGGKVGFALQEDYFVAKKPNSNLGASEQNYNKRYGYQRGESSDQWRLKSAQEWAFENGIREGPEKTKRYVKEKTLDGIILNCEAKRRPKTEPVETIPVRDLECFVDFCSGFLKLDPNIRWTAAQGQAHPFILQTSFECPFVPSIPELSTEHEDILFPRQTTSEDMEVDVDIEEDESTPMDSNGSKPRKSTTRPLTITRPPIQARGIDEKSSGLSSSQQARTKRKFDSTSYGSPSSSLASSFMGSPIYRPDVPYPLGASARWSDLGFTSPQMKPGSLSVRNLDGSPAFTTSPYHTQGTLVLGSSLPTQALRGDSEKHSAFRRLEFASAAHNKATNINAVPSSFLWNSMFSNPPASSLPDNVSTTNASSLASQNSEVSALAASNADPSAQTQEQTGVENTPSVEKSLARWAPFNQNHNSIMEEEGKM